MSSSSSEHSDLKSLKTRLDEIVSAVSDENIALDDALTLYEEAVRLGERASEIMEAGISEDCGEEPDANAPVSQDAENGKEDARDDRTNH